MTPRRVRNDMIDASEAAEPIESTEAAEPIEPIESTEPTEPIESTEPREPIESRELSDQSDHFEEADRGSTRSHYRLRASRSLCSRAWRSACDWVLSSDCGGRGR
jgi:hypothetical protein